MNNNKEILELIKRTVYVYLPDARVLLFGSRVRDDYSQDSDFDILVITNFGLDIKKKFSVRTIIRKDLLQSGIRSDILIQSKTEVNKKKRLPGHIIKNILKEAVLL